MPDFMVSAFKPLSQHSDGGDRTVGMLSSSPGTGGVVAYELDGGGGTGGDRTSDGS